jgi:hypothetical protein
MALGLPEATVKNTSDYRLLLGVVQAFVDDSFISKTRIVGDVAPGDVFSCTLGADPATRIRYSRTAKRADDSSAAGGCILGAVGRYDVPQSHDGNEPAFICVQARGARWRARVRGRETRQRRLASSRRPRGDGARGRAIGLQNLPHSFSPSPHGHSGLYPQCLCELRIVLRCLWRVACRGGREGRARE